MTTMMDHGDAPAYRIPICLDRSAKTESHQPTIIWLYLSLGAALRWMGSEEVMDVLHVALSRDSHNTAAARALVEACEQFNGTDEVVSAHLSQGVAAEAALSFDEARRSFLHALSMRPTSLDCLTHVMGIDFAEGRHSGALRHSQAVLALCPEHVLVHFYLATALHLTGRSELGWDELKWLCPPYAVTWRKDEGPLWDGSPLSGKTILLWAGPEYGLGDTIQLVRYAMPLKARGARVVVECQSRLLPLIERMPCVDLVISHNAPRPACDVHAPLLLVPVMDRTLRSPIPGTVPFLSASRRLTDCWRDRLGDRSSRQVGLSWGGSPRRRTAALRFPSFQTFIPLMCVPNVRFVSVQLGPQSQEITHTLTPFEFDELADDSCSVDDTAALILNLDLVITVDSFVAHLAGALGKPVWVLLPIGTDWRWFDDNASPWYPSMRFFRQRRWGDWAHVIDRVATALATWSGRVPEVTSAL